jgi:hypothetical protein
MLTRRKKSSRTFRRNMVDDSKVINLGSDSESTILNETTIITIGFSEGAFIRILICRKCKELILRSKTS